MMKNMGKRLGALGSSLVVVSAFGCGGKNDTPPTPSSLQVIARDGDVFPGGFEVGTIESANMSDDRTVAIIASERATPSLNGVFVHTPDGELKSVLTDGNPLAQGLSFVNVRNLSMASTGEFAVEVGNQIDNDGLFLWDGSEISVLARTGPNETPDGFRVLGAQRVTRGGVVVFVDGTSPCEIDQTNPDDPSVNCDLRIHWVQDGVVSRVEVPNALSSQTPTSVLLSVNSRGEAAVGMSARGSEPLVGRIRDGEFEGVLARRAQIGDLGVLFTARPRAISPTGAIVFDGFLDINGDGARDEQRVMLYENGVVHSVAQSGGTFEGNPEVSLRGEGVDGNDQVVFRVDFDSAAAGAVLRSLRAWKDGETRFIAHEGMPFGKDKNGNTQRILDIQQVRVGANGDVLFVAKLGARDPNKGTTTVTGTALFRWNDGNMETLLELGANVAGGTLTSEISIADVNTYGDLLLISSLNRESDRVLLLLPR